MNAADSVLRMHQHRRWVNAKLLASSAALTEPQRQQEFAIGQGSVWRSLLHMMGAEYIWLELLLGNEHPVFPGDLAGKLVGNQLAHDGMRTLDELTVRWAALETRWTEYLATLSEDELQRPIIKATRTSQPGKSPATSVMDALLHVCTHAHYTSAQLVNILRHLGVSELPDLMLISMAREASSQH